MDCTFSTELGKFNYRVGAIIANDGRILMARNPRDKRAYYYSVGGRVMFGESLEEAVLRELREETGIEAEIDRLACIRENFFTDDDGIPYHEISVFFTVKMSDALRRIRNGHLTDRGPNGEYLEWIDVKNSAITIYPPFFRTVDFGTESGVRHFITHESKPDETIDNEAADHSSLGRQ